MRTKYLYQIMLIAVILPSACTGKKYEPQSDDFIVTLEVDEYNAIDMMFGFNQNPDFRNTLDSARQQCKVKKTDFLTAFYEEWKKQSNDKLLRNAINNRDLYYRLEECNDSDVIDELRWEIEKGINLTKDIIENRLLAAGFDEYKITRLNNTFRLKIYMPQSVDHDRVVRLISSRGEFGIWETYNAEEVYSLFVELFSPQASPTGNDNYAYGLELLPNGNAVIGLAASKDTTYVNNMLHSEIANNRVPDELKFLWTASSIPNKSGILTYSLCALRNAEPYNMPLIGDERIIEAKIKADEEEHPSIYIKLDTEGCRIFNLITRQNVGRAIAIVVDGKVYAIQTIQEEKMDGEIEFSGYFNHEEAEELVVMFNSGRIALPLKIVEN